MSAPELPGEIESLIALVLDSAGLSLGERNEVERDLRAHFEDGLDAGVDAKTLVRRFGDPEEAGARIARSRRGAGRSGPGRAAAWRAGLDGFWMDLKRSARTMARSPGFALIVVATLALGVGANTAVFSVLDAVILEDLPYREPDRLVRVYEENATKPGDPTYLRGASALAYHRASDILESFATLYTYREQGADLTGGDRPERVVVSSVSAGYFETLGIRPRLGRTFLEEESTGPGEQNNLDQPHVVILSYGLWARRFSSDPNAIGQTIPLDGISFEIVGVMPRGFMNPFGSPADLWMPEDLRPGGHNTWGNYYLSGIARLKPGVPRSVAQERLRAVLAGIAESEPRAARYVPLLVPLHEDVVGPTRRPMLWFLVAAAALVLMSASVNVANLVLARGLGREREVALRGALGSGRARLIGHLLSESLLLAVAGGIAGLGVGWVGMRAVLALAPDTLPVVAQPALGLKVFAFALLITFLALAIFAAAPALRLASVAPADVLRAGDRGSTHGRGMTQVRDALVVIQVAVALVLLSGAGVLVRSLLRLQSTPLGIDPEGVFTFEVNLPQSVYEDPESRIRFHDRLDERLSAMPVTVATGAVSWLPVNGRYHTWSFYWDPAKPDYSNDDAWYGTDVRIFDGDYFRAMGIPVLEGSGAEAVERGGEGQIWVSRSIVEQVLTGGDPIGRTISINGETSRRIAGVVGDVMVDPRGTMTRTVYIPHVQFADDRNWSLTQVVRTNGDPAAVEPGARQALSDIDPSLVMYRPGTFDAHLASARARDRFATTLMAAFAALALVLTIVGTYGVLSGAVAVRSREIGIRIALGAGRRRVSGMVMRHALSLAIPGLVLGLAGAIVASRWMRALVYEVRPTDPISIGGSLLLLLLVSVFAGWLPARRATRLNPARTLTG
jgi:putative ABC transport system permease protein